MPSKPSRDDRATIHLVVDNTADTDREHKREQIEAIKDSVSRGEYQIDASRIARKMIGPKKTSTGG